MSETTCDRCGTAVPEESIKELAFEEGDEKTRVTELVCASCLDKAMNEADEVRGIGGQVKTAAAHISGEGGEAERKSPT